MSRKPTRATRGDCECCLWRNAHVELVLPGADPFHLCVLCVPGHLRDQAVPLPNAEEWVALALADLCATAGAPS